ncbi:MAG: hypothetical protein V4510_13190, partial [bacterium]
MPTKGLQGSAEFRARLKAIAATKVFTPLGKKWADETVRLQRADVPNRNTRWSKGTLHDSIRRKSATKNRATVVGRYTGYFVDAGVKPHSLQRRGKKSRTVFSRQARKGHPGYRARPFRRPAAEEALRRHPMSAEVIALWNRA